MACLEFEMGKVSIMWKMTLLPVHRRCRGQTEHWSWSSCYYSEKSMTIETVGKQINAFNFFQQRKCERYWAEVDETPLQLGPFGISCVSIIIARPLFLLWFVGCALRHGNNFDSNVTLFVFPTGGWKKEKGVCDSHSESETEWQCKCGTVVACGGLGEGITCQVL